MANRHNSDSCYGGVSRNLPDFVHDITADSITPSRMSALNDTFESALQGIHHDVFGPPSASSSHMGVVPKTAQESMDLAAASEDVKPKIKIGK